ncbi:MAG: HPr family phosphocarrier protein [Phycisphaerales bacterium]
MSDRCEITVKIVNRLGLHARPAMTFVDVASTFASEVTVSKGDTSVDGKSIMQMMMLAASEGTELQVIAVGSDAAKCCEALKKLVESGFDEE